MHPDEQVATPAQVRRLVDTQHPQWAGLPLTPVAEHGTDHVLFRLGGAMAVRMPRVGWATDQAATDARWLPELAPDLPVPVPAPLAAGLPGEGYPWPWSVVSWLPGRVPTAYAAAHRGLGADLARLVTALRAIGSDGGPVAEPGSRGASLRHVDAAVREAIPEVARLVDGVDETAVTEAWDDCVTAPDWDGPPTWVHGDLMSGNLLVAEDAPARLVGVIDFGCLAVGDPAPDLVPAWVTLAPDDRAGYLAAVGVDDATVRRGRGWAMGPALTGIPYYRDSAPAFARRGLATLAVVLDDLGLGHGVRHDVRHDVGGRG